MTRKKTILVTTICILVAASAGGIFYPLKKKDDPTPTTTKEPSVPKEEQPAETPQNTEPVFNKSLYSIDEPSSLWVVANKKRPLPSTYEPSDLVGSSGKFLRSEASQANQRLIADAQKQGVKLITISGYRSYATQQSLYASYVTKDGQAAADTYSARAGHSEHQTGLAADLGDGGSCDLEICFGSTAAGKWLAEHAHEYGFIIRYTEPKVAVTGYQYEPWHIRYVGTELANELFITKLTMEEFFNLPAAPGY